MKKGWQWLKHTVGYVALALSIPGLVYAQQQPAGVVTGLQGQAQLTRPAVPPSPLRFKDGIIIRDIVDTREKSLARILFGGRSTVTVRELTRLEVREEILPTGVRRDVYDLSSGAILVNVARQLMRPGDEVIIRTQNAVAAVRGSTVFTQCIPALVRCIFAVLFGSATVTPDGQQPVTLTPNTGLNVAGSGPGAQTTQVTISEAQANQILTESQVGRVVREEANQGQIGQAQTQTAAELATAVVEAVTKTGATTLETTTAAETGQTTTTTDTGSTKADITPDTSQTAGDQQVVVSNTTKTLTGNETLKTFDQSGSWTGSYPIVEVTGSTVDRASTGNLVQVNSGVEFTLDGTLLQITDSTITDSSALEVGGTLSNTSTETLITIDPTTVTTPTDFIVIGPGGDLTTEGQLVTDVGGTFNVGGDYLKIFDGGKLTSNTISSVFDFDSSEVNVGSDGENTHFTRVTGASSEATTKGPLVKANDTDFNIKGSAFLEVSGGGKAESTTTSPFVDLSGGSLALGAGVRALFLDSGATLDIAGSLLKAVETALTAAGGVPFMEVVDSSLKAGGSILDLVNLTADLKGSLFKATDATLTPGSGVPLFKLDPSTLSTGGPVLDLTNSPLDLGDQPVARLEGGSTLKNTAGPVIKISGGSLKADALATTDGAGNKFELTGIVLDLSNTTVTLRTTGDEPDGSTDTSTFNLAANEGFIEMASSTLKLTGEGEELVSFGVDSGDPITQTGLAVIATGTVDNPSKIELKGALLDLGGVDLTDTNPQIQLTNTTVTQTGTEEGIIEVTGLDVTTAGPFLKATDSTIDASGPVLRIHDVNFTSTTEDALLNIDPSTVTTGDHFARIDNNSTVTLAGALLSGANTTFTIGSAALSRRDILRLEDSASLESTGADPLISLNPSTLTIGRFLDVRSGATVNLAGPLLSDTGGTFNVERDFVAVRQLDSALTGTGITPLLQFSGSTLNVGTVGIGSGGSDIGDFFRVDDNVSDDATGPATVTLAGPLASDSGSTFDILLRFLLVQDGSTLTSTSPNPLIQLSGSDVTTGLDFVRFDDSSEVNLKGPLLENVGSTYAIGRALLGISDGAKVNVTTTADPFIQLSGSDVTTSSSTIFLTSLTDQLPPELSLSGTLLEAKDGTKITASDPDEGAEDLLFVADSAKLTGPPKPDGGDASALIIFDDSTLESTGPFLGLRRSLSPENPTTVELGGPLLIATGSTFDVDSSFISISESAKLKGTGTTALIQSNPSTFNIGSNFFRVNDESGAGAVNPGTPGPATVELAGPLISDTDSQFSIGNRFLFVGGGSTVSSTSPDTFIQFNGSTVETGNDFLFLSDTGSKITLSGSFLSAGSSLNIGTDPTRSGDLVDIRDGGQLVMNSSKPVVEFKGGTHTVGTDDSTTNDTPNRLFHLRGVNTDAETGLGTDQPIKGDGNDPAPFTGASNPIGTLLKATDGATIEVKRGDGDTSGGNAVRLNTILYEAAKPIIELIGSDTQETTLTTADSTMSVFKSKVVSMGSAFALDKSFINVTNGPFLIITGGTEWKVDGDLFKLFNGAKIEVVNGPLIKVVGGSVSLLEVSGALFEFGGSGNNQVIVNNDIPVTDTKSGIKVNESSGGTVLIGPNPIKNSSLGSIEIKDDDNDPNTGVLIQATNNGKVDIKAPSEENLVKNGGFETTGSIPEWNLTGAGSIITNFGTPPSAGFSPPQQQHMAIIHTGAGAVPIGSGTEGSKLSQTISQLQSGQVHLITFDYNFMSNEFPTQSTTFNDTFEAKLFHGETTTSLATESRNSSTFKTDKPSMSGGGFTLGAGNGYTDFKSASKTVVVNGDNATLEFKIFDVGDTSVDSGVLIDDVVMKLDPPLYLLTNGQTLVGPSLKPLVEYSDETVTLDSVLVSSGPPPNGTSSVRLSGPLLKAERSHLDVPFSLLGLLDGSTLVSTSSDPLVWLQDGNYSLSTLKGTAIFDLWGTKTALDPETGVEVGTGKTVQHGGPLLEASGGATVNTQKVLKLDTALLEATAPIISLIGSPNKETSLTTQQSTIDLVKAKVTSNGPVIALDKGLINVTNGPLINLTHGSNMKVTGDLISMYSGSKINVVNGPLINAAGVGSLLDVSGALVNFGGTGGNKIIVNNAITPTATLSGLPVSATQGGAINIGPNPVKNPSLGNISVTGSLISATNNGKVNIKAP